jgi:hypothetical protein
MHVNALTAPKVLEYFPAGHKLQVVDALSALYEPAEHAIHEVVLGE